MKKCKVYVNTDNSAFVTCPDCGMGRSIGAGKFRGREGPFKVKCSACGSRFHVAFEFRTVYRKEVSLPGLYAKLDPTEGGGMMTVTDVSMGGICFSTSHVHSLQEGDEIKVKFTLDDQHGSQIERIVTVKSVKGNDVGCEFKKSAEFDAALGFYLMP